MAVAELEKDEYEVLKLLVSEMISGAEEFLDEDQREAIIEQLIPLVSNEDLGKIEKEKRLTPGKLTTRKKTIIAEILRKVKNVAELGKKE